MNSTAKSTQGLKKPTSQRYFKKNFLGKIALNLILKFALQITLTRQIEIDCKVGLINPQ